MILGIDEVGRGAWAGPVVVGAVAIEPDAISGLNDSKLLSAKKRLEYAYLIRQRAAWIGIGWVSARSIDEVGMSEALKLAARRAVAGMPMSVREIIIDGTIRLVEAPSVSTLKKADQLIPAVMAASIIAKVARDNYMHGLKDTFPHYSFERHVGYGTAVHEEALRRYGPTALHRLSFAPMKNSTGVRVETNDKVETDGARAESVAAQFLEQRGFTIFERNWKTKQCEIDIIAEKAGIIYFTEVKYRKIDVAGKGFSYITDQKQRQMAFAAESWIAFKKWQGPVNLAAIQVEGDDFTVTGFVAGIPAMESARAQTRQFGL